MTLTELKAKHTALLTARYAGLRSVNYDGRSVTYGSDAELATAIADIERRIAALGSKASRISRSYAVKDL